MPPSKRARGLLQRAVRHHIQMGAAFKKLRQHAGGRSLGWVATHDTRNSLLFAGTVAILQVLLFTISIVWVSSS